MLAATYDTVSDIEILWTVIALSGVGFGAFNLRDAWLDRKAVIEAKIGNGRKTIANYSVRSEAARMVVQVIFLLIGLGAMGLEDPPQHVLPTKIVVFNALVQWGLITSAALILFKSIDAYVTRHKLVGGRD